MLCNFCNNDLPDYDRHTTLATCVSCNPEIDYMCTSKQECFLTKYNNENAIIYYYNFDTLEFTIRILSYDEDSNEFLALKKVLNSSIENVKLSSAKEMENFGDKVLNMALFT